MDYKELLEKAKEASKNTYSPYSNFPVGACLVTPSGKTFVGTNVENASFGATICAERSAITAAISAGYGSGDFSELNIMVSSGEIGMPCFICRQVIAEFFDKDAIVRCYATDGRFKEYKVEELCPYPFGHDDLI